MAIFPEFILLDAREIVNQKYDVCNEKIVAEKLYSTLMANKKFKKYLALPMCTLRNPSRYLWGSVKFLESE